MGIPLVVEDEGLVITERGDETGRGSREHRSKSKEWRRVH